MAPLARGGGKSMHESQKRAGIGTMVHAGSVVAPARTSLHDGGIMTPGTCVIGGGVKERSALCK